MDIIGHNEIRAYFLNALSSNALSHAHLIVGENGIGKSLIAREFAARILGEKEYRKHIDIIEFRNTKNKKTIGIGEIRDIIEEVNKKPYEGSNKVVIIYNGDSITIPAQNALLKTIEEPPGGVYVFILCENYEMILETVKSRCQVHRLNRLNLEEIKAFIQKKYGELPDAQFHTLVAFAQGIPGECEKFMENENFIFIRNTLARFLTDIKAKQEAQLQEYVDFFVKYKDINEEVTGILISYIRDVIVYKDIESDSIIINKDKLELIKEWAVAYSYTDLNSMIGIINNARKALVGNVNPMLVFDIMVFDIKG